MSTNGAIHPSPGQRPGNQVKTYATIGIEGEHHWVASFQKEQRKFFADVRG
jgi:hypothetical protein